jgi:hypothetical protein
LEAISRKKEVDEMKTLAKEFGNLLATKLGPALTIDTSATDEGWEQPIPGIFINRTYFDLAGMSMDGLTLFFEGAAIQDTLNPATSPSTAGNNAIILDIMSNKPITDAEAQSALFTGNMSTGLSNLTFDQTIYMRLRFLNTDIDNAAGGFMITVTDNQLGSLEPTASDRIYCTRVVTMGGADGNYNVYPVRYLLRALAKEEPEYEYLMRLKRSYELQQRIDRD